MARGSTKETAEKERERRTAELFRQLESVNRPAEKQPLVNELAELNLPLCDALAKRYAGRGCDREDLLQVARVGLLAAIGRFRPGDGTSFAGFAVPTIAGELKRHFRDNCWVVRPPRRVQELRPQALIARVELTQEYGREPNLSEPPPPWVNRRVWSGRASMPRIAIVPFRWTGPPSPIPAFVWSTR